MGRQRKYRGSRPDPKNSCQFRLESLLNQRAVIAAEPGRSFVAARKEYVFRREIEDPSGAYCLRRAGIRRTSPQTRVCRNDLAEQALLLNARLTKLDRRVDPGK